MAMQKAIEEGRRVMTRDSYSLQVDLTEFRSRNWFAQMWAQQHVEAHIQFKSALARRQLAPATVRAHTTLAIPAAEDVGFARTAHFVKATPKSHDKPWFSDVAIKGETREGSDEEWYGRLLIFQAKHRGVTHDLAFVSKRCKKARKVDNDEDMENVDENTSDTSCAVQPKLKSLHYRAIESIHESIRRVEVLFGVKALLLKERMEEGGGNGGEAAGEQEEAGEWGAGGVGRAGGGDRAAKEEGQGEGCGEGSVSLVTGGEKDRKGAGRRREAARHGDLLKIQLQELISWWKKKVDGRLGPREHDPFQGKEAEESVRTIV
ncbi:unnamed protein product [Closterium sp. Yama58-4]|nr:unnamed protein product [Closterium sp. Yama58-4]